MHSQRRLFWFRRLALAGALLAAAVVVLGAWVRLTNAGLGCPDWPGCYGHLYPNAGHGDPQTGFRFGKALHEMIHRYFAGTLGLVITLLLVWSVRYRKDRDQPLIPPALLFVVVCLQGALGALTVTLLLKPLIVTAHLFGGLATLGLLWWLSLHPERRQLPAREAGLPKESLLGLRGPSVRRTRHVRAVVVVVAPPRTAATACARGGLAKVCSRGSRRPDHANRSRGVDQQQLRRGGVPGFTHLDRK